MKLQVASRLAIYAVLELAGAPDAQMSAAEIGAKYGVSTHHLAKVMHTLGRAGLVRSVRGARGGYQFSGNAKRTTLMQVIELFENVGGSDSENLEAGEDTPAGHALGRVLGEIDDLTRATFSSITLSTMLKMMPPPNRR
jgi:Rrf2 family transcriptional regulator, nitric oxide-sensitive transcriptional repressor